MNDFLYVMVGIGIGLFISEWILDPRRRTMFTTQLHTALDNEGIRRSEFNTLEKKMIQDVGDLNAKIAALRDRING